jgi:hypothetical protein
MLQALNFTEKTLVFRIPFGTQNYGVIMNVIAADTQAETEVLSTGLYQMFRNLVLIIESHYNHQWQVLKTH